MCSLYKSTASAWRPCRFLVYGSMRTHIVVSGPHTTIYLKLLYMCTHTTLFSIVRLYILILLHVSSYCYTCVCILLYMCPHTAICVPSYCYLCVRILLNMRPHARTYVCPHTATRALILLHVSVSLPGPASLVLSKASKASSRTK